MPSDSWNEIDKLLAAKTTTTTARQRELAKLAGIRIRNDQPKIVTAAILRLALADDLYLPRSRPLSDRYEERLDELRRTTVAEVAPNSDDVAEAWVTHLRLVRRRKYLSKMRLQRGDIVQIEDDEQFAEVSSIGDDGRVFFKGGHGFGAWPDLISVVARSGDNSDSAIRARRNAENTTARRSERDGWSDAKSRELSEFQTTDKMSEDDLAQLEETIGNAKDERPIQKFLANNGHLLTALLGGRERYCIPQKRLGCEFVPDFVIGDTDSLGIRWVLVELETPRSGIYTSGGDELDAKTRKGLSQIMNWRAWLGENVAYARRSNRENGLGLFNIAEDSRGVVIVGRRSLMPDTKESQRIFHRKSGVEIHTYDWLIEQLRGISHHDGPPGCNRFLIRRDSTAKSH